MTLSLPRVVTTSAPRLPTLSDTAGVEAVSGRGSKGRGATMHRDDRDRQRDRLKQQTAFRARVAHKRRVTERALSERASAKAAFNDAMEKYKGRELVGLLVVTAAILVARRSITLAS
jgi:hypothetical protein